jgi:hypothetical protein
MNAFSYLPFFSSIISFVFAFYVFRRYLVRRGYHLLLWTIGMVFYGLGGFCEAYYAFFGWSGIIFRMWYLFGAILVAVWLGQGTVYLLARPKVAHVTMALVVLASLYAVVKVFGAQLDPTLMTASMHTGSELSGQAIVSPGVRILTPFFNLYGTITLTGGALYSSWMFWRKRIMMHRAIGNVLIAVGAILPAFGGTFSALGIPGALYLTEFLGTILLFLGFLRATTPMRAKDGSLEQVVSDPYHAG